MKTSATVTLDDDVADAVERYRKERSIGLSQAVNELVRAGLRTKSAGRPVVQRSHDMGLRINVTNVAEALEELEGPARG